MDANYAEPAVTPNTILEILNKLGLTKNESKVYAYLSKNGPTKAKIITQN
jgi:sugar-specific transcriptional regulator TrmB